LANVFSGFWFSTIPPYSNGDIGTDFSADGATRACLIFIPTDVKISLTIDFLSDSNQGFRTGDGTESAAFTSLTIYFDFSHESFLTNLINQTLRSAQSDRGVILKEPFVYAQGKLRD
jgi:hypothetical protein